MKEIVPPSPPIQIPLNNNKSMCPIQFPVVQISQKLRQEIDAFIKSNPINSKPVQNGKLLKDSKYPINQRLERMGFRKAHVKEALEISNNFTFALNWLCIHVPEDDLPSGLLGNEKMSAVQHDSESLAREYALRRLLKAGFPRSICERELDLYEGDEARTLQSLIHILAGTDIQTFSSYEVDTTFIDTCKIEESEAMRAIFGERCQISNNGDIYMSIELDPICLPSLKGSRATLDIIISQNSRYPFELPGIILHNDRLPAYIRLNGLKGVALKALEDIGSPMVYSITTWMEENLDNIIKSPPLLANLSNLLLDESANKQSESDEAKKTTFQYIEKTKKSPHSHSMKSPAVMKNGKETISPRYKDRQLKRQSLPAYKFENKIIEVSF